jgi:hypothetical protein
MTSKIPRLRIVAFNDVYELANLPRLQSFLSSLSPSADAVLLAGDFLSPSTLSALDGGKGTCGSQFTVMGSFVYARMMNE